MVKRYYFLSGRHSVLFYDIVRALRFLFDVQEIAVVNSSIQYLKYDYVFV